jgi:hypothetical protein
MKKHTKERIGTHSKTNEYKSYLAMIGQVPKAIIPYER